MDIDLEKELKVRRRILAIYNKDREDFSTKDEYDDYLETVEDIIWRLASNVDIERTEAQVRKYRQQNQEQINAKTARQADLGVVDSQLAGTQLSGTIKAAAPPITGGLPMVLPKLAQDYASMLDAARNIRYDQRALAHAGAAAAAAGGWSSAVCGSRLTQEALSSLLPPLRLVEGLGG